jgi:hypothetical protein
LLFIPKDPLGEGLRKINIFKNLLLNDDGCVKEGKNHVKNSCTEYSTSTSSPKLKRINIRESMAEETKERYIV